MHYRGGGRQQVVTFNHNGTPHELVLAGDKPLLPELTVAAEVLKANLNIEGS